MRSSHVIGLIVGWVLCLREVSARSRLMQIRLFIQARTFYQSMLDKISEDIMEESPYQITQYLQDSADNIQETFDSFPTIEEWFFISTLYLICSSILMKWNKNGSSYPSSFFHINTIRRRSDSEGAESISGRGYKNARLLIFIIFIVFTKNLENAI